VLPVVAKQMRQYDDGEYLHFTFVRVITYAITEPTRIARTWNGRGNV